MWTLGGTGARAYDQVMPMKNVTYINVEADATSGKDDKVERMPPSEVSHGERTLPPIPRGLVCPLPTLSHKAWTQHLLCAQDR
jgi:hypothetical protein